jgi:chromosome segregation ATPase
MILEDQYKQAQNELLEKQEQLKQVRPATAKVNKDKATIKTLENQLDKNLVKYNQLQSENKSLRQQIDVMRKEMMNQTRVNKGYEKEIVNANDKCKKMNATAYQGQRVSEETQN